jgi:hypothetical protein
VAIPLVYLRIISEYAEKSTATIIVFILLMMVAFKPIRLADYFPASTKLN